MATLLSLSDWLEQELIEGLYHDYVRDDDGPTRKELRGRLDSLIKRLDECSVYEDAIVRAARSPEPYTCNAYPAKLVEQTAHQAGVALLRLMLQAIRENVRGELAPMQWVDQETGEPIRENEVLGEVKSERGKPMRPNAVLKPMRIDRVEVDRLILAIRRERELVRSSAMVVCKPGQEDGSGYLDLLIDPEHRTVSREGYDCVPIPLTSRQWEAFLLLYKARGEEVSLGSFKPPAYRGSTKGGALRNVFNELGTKLFPLDVDVIERALKDCRRT